MYHMTVLGALCIYTYEDDRVCRGGGEMPGPSGDSGESRQQRVALSLPGARARGCFVVIEEDADDLDQGVQERAVEIGIADAVS